MALFDLFKTKPKLEHSNPKVRKAAVGKVADQKILANIVKKDRDADVRKAAIIKITDQNIIADVARKEINAGVRLAAIEKLTDQKILKEFANEDEDVDVRKAAIKNITNQKFLARIAQNIDERIYVRAAAIANLTDQEILIDIAKNDDEDIFRAGAIIKITDQNIIADIARKEINAGVRLAAIEKLTDQKILEEFANEDEDVDVRKASKSKLSKQKKQANIKPSKSKSDSLESNENISVLGLAVPVIKDMTEFSDIVQKKCIPIGLFVRMVDFTSTYGNLQFSVPNSGMGGYNPFYVNHENGPCRLFCYGCQRLFPGSFIFRLPDGAGESFGQKPVKRCPDCGSKNAVIVFTPPN